MDTDINTMMLYYELTLDRKYYDRAVEFVDYHHHTLDEAKRELTYFEYCTSALRIFHAIFKDPTVRRKIEEIFLASYTTYLEERGYLGNMEVAAFAYELSPSRKTAQ